MLNSGQTEGQALMYAIGGAVACFLIGTAAAGAWGESAGIAAGVATFFLLILCLIIGRLTAHSRHTQRSSASERAAVEALARGNQQLTGLLSQAISTMGDMHTQSLNAVQAMHTQALTSQDEAHKRTIHYLSGLTERAIEVYQVSATRAQLRRYEQSGASWVKLPDNTRALKLPNGKLAEVTVIDAEVKEL